VILLLAVGLLFLTSTCSRSRTPTTAEPTAIYSPTGTATPPPTEFPVEPGAGVTPVARPERVEIPDEFKELAPGLFNVVETALNAVLGLDTRDWTDLAISILIVVLAILFVRSLLGFVLRQVAKRTATPFDDKLVEMIGPLVEWLVVVFVFQIATYRLGFLTGATRQWLGTLYFLVYLGIGFLLLWKLIDYAVQWYTGQLPPDVDSDRLGMLVPLVERTTKVVLVVFAIDTLLSHFGVSIHGIATAVGIGGLAISLAAQDTISDTIAGYIILVDRPFRIGDRIEIEGVGTWGDVVDIGTRTTRIRTRDNRLVIVPNGTIGKSQVVNYTYPDPHYRIEMELGIGYGEDIEKVRRIIVDTVRNVEGVLRDQPVDALYVKMGDSDMIFRVRWWIESYVDTRRMFDQVNTALQEAFDEAGIEMPGTYDVNLKIGDEDASRFAQAFREAI
jgi:small-conductance mechanosensitive channel